MSHKTALPIAVLDTNVLIPIEIRDILFWFAHDHLYTIQWSKHIFHEWKSVMTRKGLGEVEISKRLRWATEAFPLAMVHHYEPLVETLALPDEKDRHVLAAAIKSKASVIVTNNLKDFPPTYLATWHIEAYSPDRFLSQLLRANPTLCMHSFKKLVANRKNPTLSFNEVVSNLHKNGLVHTATLLQKLSTV